MSVSDEGVRRRTNEAIRERQEGEHLSCIS